MILIYRKKQCIDSVSFIIDLPLENLLDIAKQNVAGECSLSVSYEHCLFTIIMDSVVFIASFIKLHATRSESCYYI